MGEYLPFFEKGNGVQPLILFPYDIGTSVLGQDRDLVLVMASPEPFENSLPLPGEPELVELPPPELPPPELPELTVGGLQPLPPGEEVPLMSCEYY